MREIRVGIIGMGSMGTGLYHQVRLTPGFRCVAVSDVVKSRCPESTGCRRTNMGLSVVLDGEVDVLIEASSAVAEAGIYAEAALKQGKAVVMMNAEADLMFGPYLATLGKYTTCDGDQPGVLARMIREIEFWGFDVRLIGNIKGFLDRHATPESIKDWAVKQDQSIPMTVAMTDGTKVNVEMALLANAYYAEVFRPGMLGPARGTLAEAFDFFVPSLEKMPHTRYVDYVLGAEPGGGVFVIAYCDDFYQQSMLKYYKMGDGPYYLFYRHCHLCHIEALRCVQELLDGKPLLVPQGLLTNVFAYAKHDLNPGQVLGGMGGSDCYGQVECELWEGADENRRGLPICLAHGLKLKVGVEEGVRIGRGQVEGFDHAIGVGMYKKALCV